MKTSRNLTIIFSKSIEFYANIILLKGKIENNNQLIYDGYYKIAHSKAQKPSEGQIFADSLISLTKNLNNHDFPAKACIIKGILSYKAFNYKDALEYYIKAQKQSKDKNEDQYFYIKKLIGILKTATEEYPEALSLFLEYYNYEKNNLDTKNRDVKSYIGSIFSVSNAYSKNKNYLKSKGFNKLGISECKKYNDFSHYTYFLMSEGIADFYLNDFPNAKKNLLVVENKLKKNDDKSNLSIVYYFLGKIYLANKERQNAIEYFIKSDSVALISNDFLPVTRDEYEILIDYYKSLNDKENQLKYIKKLVYADSIINSNKQYLSKEIYKKYDTPLLMEEKEKLISDLNNKNHTLFWVIFLLTIGSLVILYYYFKNKKKVNQYKQQAELLLQKNTISQTKFEKVEIEKPNTTVTLKQEKAKGSLSDQMLEDIKKKLEAFEKKQSFIKRNITVESLAKDFETNRDYLSKSVNELKGKNFSQYLNELRINFVIKELQINEKMRKYTISAIAQEIGYNTPESFSNAFKKATGTLPSFYIKVLQENKQNNENQPIEP